MRSWKSSVMVGVAVLFLAGPAFAYHDEYDDSESNPFRVAAYALHPVGYTLEWLVFRPLHALVSQPELEPIFGHYRPHGWGFEAGIPEVSEVPEPPPAAPPPAMSTADAEAARRAAEEARAAAEEAKRAAEEAARAAEKATRGFEKSLRK